MNAQCTLHATLARRSSLVSESLPDLASLDLCSPVSPPRCETWIAAAAYPIWLRLNCPASSGRGFADADQSDARSLSCFCAHRFVCCSRFVLAALLAFCSPALVASVQASSLYELAVSNCARRCASSCTSSSISFPSKVPPSTIGFLSYEKELVTPWFTTPNDSKRHAFRNHRAGSFGVRSVGSLCGIINRRRLAGGSPRSHRRPA